MEYDGEKRDVIRLFVRTHYQFEVQWQKAIADGFAEATGAMQDQQSPDQKVMESLVYRDAPDDIKRQIEQQLGFQPSQMQPNEDDPEHQKAQNTALLNQQKALNDSESDRYKTESQADLEQIKHDHQMQLTAATHQHDRQTKADDHARAMEAKQLDQAHAQMMADKQSQLKVKEMKAAPKPTVAKVTKK